MRVVSIWPSKVKSELDYVNYRSTYKSSYKKYTYLTNLLPRGSPTLLGAPSYGEVRRRTYNLAEK